MCGIAGYLNFNHSEDTSANILESMISTLRHRGPDDYGTWLDKTSEIALAHSRLSILDLSPSGHQPMFSPCGRFVIVFNGEIYNFLQLRNELENLGLSFSTHTDTEVLLVAISHWGLQNALKKCNGMFAFALWDKNEHTLQLARDRFGKKPLYYSIINNTLIFASELKSICKHPSFNRDINSDSLGLYLRYGYVPEPYAIYKNTFKVKPSHIITIRLKQKMLNIQDECYWFSEDLIKNSHNNPFQGSEAAAAEQLESLLTDAVKLRMISDVPLGAFLSGGIDSTMIVSLMQKISTTPVKTFTVGFEDPSYNEAKQAAEIANYLKTDHFEMYVSPRQAMEVISKLPTLYDEPFSDSSQIPTFLISQLTRQHVTVALSGDGGDEIFAGYNRYVWVNQFGNHIKRIPNPLRKPIFSLLKTLPPHYWDKLFKNLGKFIPQLNHRNPGDKLYKLIDLLEKESPEKMYQDLTSFWGDPQQVLKSNFSNNSSSLMNYDSLNFSDMTHKMMYMDIKEYLVGDILTKVDRASMATSLEVRSPFLDPRVVDFSWSLPLEMKIKNTKTKYLLRKILYNHVPQTLLERPKMGFAVPIDSWLRGDLREWAESLLDKNRLNQEGFFNSEIIHNRWNEHLNKSRNWQNKLWNILMFQEWLKYQKASF